MGIEHHWQSPTSASTQTDVVLPSVRLGDYGFAEDGQEGAVATGSIDVDDPDAAYDLQPWQRYYALETAGPSSLVLTGTVAKSTTSLTITGTGTAFLSELAPGDEVAVPGGGGTDYLWIASVTDNTHAVVYYVPVYSASGQTATRCAQQRIFTGWSGPEIDQSGGEDLPRAGSEPVGFASSWHVPIAELNAALHLRMCRDATFGKSGGAGGATTIGDRLTAVLGAPEAALIHDDAGLGLVTYSATACDKDNLQGRYLDDLFSAMSQTDRRNHALVWHEATDHAALVFKKPSTNIMASPALITDDVDEPDGDLVFRTIGRSKLVRQGDIIAAGVQVTGARRNYYVPDSAIGEVYEYRDISAANSSLKTSATATAFGNAILADADSPDTKVLCKIKVPASQVHLFRKLRCISVRFAHLRGWESTAWASILRRELGHYSEGDKISWSHYLVALVLGPAEAPPPPPTYTFAQLQYDNQTADPHTVSSELIEWQNTGDSPHSGWTSHPKQGLVDYDDTGHVTSGYKTGLKVTGTGTLDSIKARVSWNFVYTSDGHSVTVAIAKNGVTIASATYVDPHTGGGAHGFVRGPVGPDASGIAVVPNDIITVEVSWTADPAIGKIPAGIPGPNSEYLSLSGALS